MIGKYDIEVYNNRVHYFLTVKRNFTILQGNSATGKTELIRLIQEHEANGISSGITLQSNVPCTVLTSIDWELRLSSLLGHIIFIDETASFLKTGRFSELAVGSDNYFVIVTRDDLPRIPYSVEEIYGLRNATDTQKYKAYKRIYNEAYQLYHFDYEKQYIPDKVVTEDSNSGYDFFDIVYPGKCISAHGKSRVYEEILKLHEYKMLIIVDGAAFGPEVGKVLRYLESSNQQCVLYAPESFEYLVLSAGFLDVPKTVLEEPYLFADSKKFASWEMFFSDYLANITRNSVYQYGKSKLAPAYKTEGTVKRITAVMPQQILCSECSKDT